jgi:hypothetical protein
MATTGLWPLLSFTLKGTRHRNKLIWYTHTRQPIPVMGLLICQSWGPEAHYLYQVGHYVEVCKPWDLGQIPVIHILNCQ